MRRPLVVVVDDAEDNREMYIDYLATAGFRAEGAADGASAIEAARTLLPALIVMDLSLPGIDGLAATRILKADPLTRDILVIALTGHAEPKYREAAQSAGCDLFLAKPCSPQTLLDAICRVLDRAEPEGSASSGG
jgi:two-component system cell cycle response regulator DivK